MEKLELMRPGKTIDLASPLFDDKGLVGEEKIDGLSGQIRFDSDGNARCWKATLEVTDNLPPLFCEQLADTDIQVEWAAGDPVTPGVTATFLAKDGWQRAVFPRVYVLDVMRVRRKDLTGFPWKKRKVYIDDISCALDWDWPELDVMTPERAYVGKRHWAKTLMANGGEGVVLKGMDSLWSPGRSPDQYKCKAIHEIECWVRGYIPGNGKFEDLAGSLVLELYDEQDQAVDVGQCSGMTDETREELTERLDNGNSFVVTVRFLRWSRHGRLIQPRFQRVRDDKTIDDCTLALQKGKE